MCPKPSAARLSYHLAEAASEENTKLLANPPASAGDTENLDCWTLHQPPSTSSEGGS
ncbi:hypothetical protein [Streptomyces sioyaensis]|uniref:hypothetical protein n=1 Tax=Streptomyces sioyaensis TaxID=67364 RepID=UPI0036E730A8